MSGWSRLTMTSSFSGEAPPKDTFPGQLDASVGGHVEVGQSYEQAAVMEVEEEAGLIITPSQLQPLVKLKTQAVDDRLNKRNLTFRQTYWLPYDGKLEDLRVEAALIEKGPPPLDESDLKRRRYFISDLLDDLRDDRPPGEVTGCLSGLFFLLGDFHLRAQNQWSGNGKGLIRRLRQLDADFAARYEQDFAKAFRGNLAPVEKLVVHILQPYGGLF
jgi:8-oxo-dGTP pyrophosphatase MutT (NUDIX family)